MCESSRLLPRGQSAHAYAEVLSETTMKTTSRLAEKPCIGGDEWQTTKFLSEKSPPAVAAPLKLSGRNEHCDLAEQFRHSGWAPFRRRVMDAMAAVPCISERRASAFRGCGCDAYVEWRWVSSARVGKEWRVRSTKCHDRFCVPCSADRSSRIRSSLLQHMYRRDNMKLLTLTLKASDATLTAILDRLTRCFRLLRNRPIWKKNVMGGCAIIETKVGQGSGEWHAHFHVLLEAKFISHAVLADEWEKITGDSRIVDIRPMQAHGGGVQYITKYVTKAGDPSIVMSPKHLQEALIAFTSRRLISTFGSWRGLQLSEAPDDDMVSSTCGEWASFGRLDETLAAAARGEPDAVAIVRQLRRGPARPPPAEGSAAAPIA